MGETSFAPVTRTTNAADMIQTGKTATSAVAHINPRLPPTN